MNGAEGFSDIESKMTRVGASECGQRMSFKMCAVVLNKPQIQCEPNLAAAARDQTLQHFNDSTVHVAIAISDWIDRRLLCVRLSIRTHQVPDHALIAGISFTGFALEEFQG